MNGKLEEHTLAAHEFTMKYQNADKKSINQTQKKTHVLELYNSIYNHPRCNEIKTDLMHS